VEQDWRALGSEPENGRKTVSSEGVDITCRVVLLSAALFTFAGQEFCCDRKPFREVQTVKKSTKKPAGTRKTTSVKKAVRKTAKKAAAKTTKKTARKAAKKKTAASAKKPATSAKKTAAKTAKAKLGSRDKKALLGLLLNMRDRLRNHVAALKDASLKRNDSVISPEDGTDVFDRQFALNLASTENEAVFEIDEALRRLDEGSYGLCEECSCLIGLPRLKALPFVRTCIKCQSEREKKGPARFRPI